MLLLMWLACADESMPEAPPPEAQVVQPDKPPGPGGMPMGEARALRLSLLEQLRQELGEAYDAPVPGLEAADAQRGAVLYAQHCLDCHGPKGRGRGPKAAELQPRPSDLTHPGKARFFSDAARVAIIRQGFTGSAMQGFDAALDGPAVLDVYAHLLTLRGALRPGQQVHDRPPKPDGE